MKAPGTETSTGLRANGRAQTLTVPYEYIRDIQPKVAWVATLPWSFRTTRARGSSVLPRDTPTGSIDLFELVNEDPQTLSETSLR